MLISLLVLLVPVLLLVGGYQLIAGRTQPVAVDPAPALSAAETAGLAVMTPDGLAAGWVPISATYQPQEQSTTVRIGYVTPAGGSAQVVQSDLPAEQLLPSVLPERAAPAGTVELAGRTWQRYPAPGGEQALVWLAPELTVVVTGATADGELAELAGSLR